MTTAAAFDADDHPQPDTRLEIGLPTGAMDKVPLGIARLDRQGMFTYANRTWLRIAGLDTWAGRTVHDLFRGDDLAAVLDGLRRRGQREGDAYQATLTRPDGTRVPISITAFPETQEGGQVIGTLALVRDLTLERATQRIVKHIEDLTDTTALLDAIADVVKPIVPYDQLQVLRLNKDRSHVRTIYPPDVQKSRTYRWWQIPCAMRHMLHDRDVLRINDLAGWYAQMCREGMAAEKAIEDFIQQGYNATMSLPVFQNKVQVASIVLSRMHGRVFTDEEAQIAVELPLTEAVSVAQRNDTENNLNFLIRLIQDIVAACDSVQSVSQTVVNRIAAHYGWDYVSIHQVDTARGKIRLIAQKAAGPDLESEQRELDIDKGIIGSVHRTRRAVRVGDVTTDARYADTFVPHRKTRTCSELCVPIGPEASWLLNVEDVKTDAFCHEDETSLQKVADSLDALLRRTLDFNYRLAVVENAKDAILLVNPNQVVFEANAAASQLLGRPRDGLVGHPIAEFLAEKSHASLRHPTQSLQNHGAQMLRRGDHGPQPVQVLLSVARLPDETPGRVFIASDLTQYVRSDELAVARDLYREITGQVKTPMTLAITWLRRFSRLAAPAAGDLPEKVLQQLQKAELTLDRMLLIERGHRFAQRLPTLLPVDEVVARSLEELPTRERESVVVGKAPGAWVRADAFELRYCLQTVLTYLLRLAVHATRIELRIREGDGKVGLEIGGRADVSRQSDFISQCRGGQAMTELSLGRETLAEIAARNGGTFWAKVTDEQALFAFSFPAALAGDPT